MESRDLSRRKVVSGHFPECGAIFMSNRSTLKECFEKRLLGLPESQSGFVSRVKAGMILFLFETEERKLYGVFEAVSDGGMDIVPQAYASSGRWFPAQVKFTSIWHCDPLSEDLFRDAIRDNYFTTHRFNFGLSMDQVQSLLWIFSSRKLQIPKSLHHNKRKNREQGCKYKKGEVNKVGFGKIETLGWWKGTCEEPEMERHLSSDFCRTSASIPSDVDAYDPDHPGFLHSDNSEVHSVSGHELQELLALQEKKDNSHSSTEDTEDFIPLFSPDHSDVEEEEGFDFNECSADKQIELGIFAGDKVSFIPVPQLPPPRPISSNDRYNPMKMDHPFASPPGSPCDTLDDSSASLPLSGASNLQSNDGNDDLRSLLTKGMYADKAKKKTSVFSRLNFSSKNSSSKNQNAASGKKLMNHTSRLKQRSHDECDKVEKVTLQKHEVEDCNVDKRTSVFMRLTRTSYAQEVHCMTTVKERIRGSKTSKKKIKFSEWEYNDNVGRSQEMLADGFQADISVPEILEKLWHRHANRREYCGKI
ncbi:hypothetical protein RIF29_38635 [Crotalaria pallida]|uniref:DCD domain-containing protein n=1 Tax=Crotalaria pallida TaxID=3830 RepID=A0AAN9DZP8_CROPI